MEEQAWLTSNDPAAMLAWLVGTGRRGEPCIRHPVASARKSALFVEACHALCSCRANVGVDWPAKAWAALTDVGGCACTRAARADLLRCIFGNPWRSVSVWIGDPDRSVSVAPLWITPAVANFARTIDADRDFAALPVLADALEEAGCDDVRCSGCRGRGAGRTVICPVCQGHGWLPNPLLQHLRGPGPHVCGCWCLDLLLGKE